MKVIVFGMGNAPQRVQQVQTLQLHDGGELEAIAKELSGGPFVIVVLREFDVGMVTSVARLADPMANVLLVQGDRLVHVLGRPGALPTRFTS